MGESEGRCFLWDGRTEGTCMSTRQRNQPRVGVGDGEGWVGPRRKAAFFRFFVSSLLAQCGVVPGHDIRICLLSICLFVCLK